MKLVEKSDAKDQSVNSEELLLLRNVYKNYGSVEALKGMDLAATKGECLVILGPSGAGKTTTLKVIAGLESVKSGEIYFKNRTKKRSNPVWNFRSWYDCTN